MGSPPPTTPPRDGLDVWKPPEEFDEYRLIRPLGRGGNGQVFLAHDTLLERAVAVKFIPALDASALARFLNEARAAARVQHPNVVTLYRVGQLDERAYLVSEYTRGVSLDRVKKPLPWRKVLELALKLTRGLAAAHRRGVLHRDIKPGNAILTETGEVKLLDFGLAKLFDASVQPAGTAGERLARAAAQVDPQALELQSESSRLSFPLNSPSSALVGTPYYMSPEAWRSEDHTARSDLYSLGAMLYELCAGKGPFRDVPLDELRVVVEARPAAPLSQVAPDVDPSFAAVVDRCLRRDPLERFPSADALLDALEALQAHGGAAHVPEGNPYRGLRPFEAEHRALFFGRRRDLAAVLERLRAEPFLLLTGDSGVGKSSLCAAGVLPHVLEGALEDGRKWAVLRLVPGRRPLAALATAAAPVLGEEEPRLAAEISAEPEAFVRKLRSRLGAQSGLLLYVDQLEELVTLAPPEDARRFAEVLAPLAAGVAGARLIGSARSDFLTRLAGLPRLGEALTRALYLVRPMGDEEVREAVVGPARVKGVGFESEALVRTLVDSTVAAGGGLPLLQFALAQLWEARDVQRAVITATALTALGGVAGALARHADGVIDSLPPEQRSAARLLLLRLVTNDGTRARRTEDELTGGDPRSRAALEAMVHGRLLVARDTEEGGTF
ncbi:MAG TPA: serine/threonine-protein kinase, partial [Myxococcaceae bacterium]|nr:serine/threonine-protein kinase [Myxococcaceae bacterium]